MTIVPLYCLPQLPEGMAQCRDIQAYLMSLHKLVG
jgi:hypothetical protein